MECRGMTWPCHIHSHTRSRDPRALCAPSTERSPGPLSPPHRSRFLAYIKASKPILVFSLFISSYILYIRTTSTTRLISHSHRMSSHLSYQYAVGDRVLLSSRISRYLKASPLSVAEQMSLPRGQITDVVATLGGSPVSRSHSSLTHIFFLTHILSRNSTTLSKYAPQPRTWSTPLGSATLPQETQRR